MKLQLYNENCLAAVETLLSVVYLRGQAAP